MPNPEDGTTDFRVGGLKDLLESQEAPPKGSGGGGKNRQSAIIGAAVGVVVVVLLAVVLLGGGGDGGIQDAGDGIPVGIDMKPSAAVGIQQGKKASICDTASGPIAEGVVVQGVKAGKSNVGADIVTLTVLASGDDINDLGPTNAKSTWRAIASETCPAVTTTSPAAETSITTQPPATSPPDSVPTPPPSG